VYEQKPARLRMNRLVRPATNKPDFELFSLAVSAINGCGTCMQAHERVVVQVGITEEQVHDAVRLAATIQATAVALEMAEPSIQGAIDNDSAGEAAASLAAASL
jgi:alkyl hydroperoxide reductase subunit D